MIYLALIGSVASGVVAVLKCKLDDPRRLKLVTAFTGAYLMALTCLHLIPEVFGGEHHHHGDHHHGPDAVTLGTFILLGFFLQVALDNFSGGTGARSCSSHFRSHAAGHDWRSVRPCIP